MNCINIKKNKDFNYIINSDLILTGCIDEEIEHNWWAIRLKQKFAETVSTYELQNFIKELLIKKREQVSEYSVPATCYLWVDEQSFQLCFNIITGHTMQLPFGCKINLVKDIEPLLQKFIDLNIQGVISFDEVTFVDEISNDDDPTNYILDVYVDLI